MQYGQIPFDMTVNDRLTGSRDYCLLKRWKKHTIYAKSGSWNRTDNPSENLYVTNSIYLYDYVLVTKTWYNTLVYTDSVADTVVGNVESMINGPIVNWNHAQYTFQNSPNSKTNNYTFDVSIVSIGAGINTAIYNGTIFTDQGEYFELVDGYPKNHHINKRNIFSLYNLQTFGRQNGVDTSGSYWRCQETINSTIGQDGLEDGTSPVQTFTVGNLNLVQGSNVINR